MPEPAPRAAESIRLPAVGFGTERRLEVVRYGRRGARPKAYVQASLHADEVPAMLVARHLLARLDEAAASGAVAGEVVVVPFANPIGLAQNLHGTPLGRYEFATGGNFNRGFPQLADPVAAKVDGRLGADEAANVAIIRAAMREVLDEQRATGEVQALKLALMRLAYDADVVLDLHTDWEALVHVYTGTPLWPSAADLSAEIGSVATLLAEESGGYPFDEALSGPWWQLARRFGPDRPVPPACLAATVELRGRNDVDDALAARDADALVRFLRRRGVLTGEPGPLPAPLCEATPLAAVDMLRAPVEGILVYRAGLGDRVRPGTPIADVVGADGGRTTVQARSEGVLFTRRGDRWVRPGDPLGKIAGREPLPDRTGHLLTD